MEHMEPFLKENLRSWAWFHSCLRLPEGIQKLGIILYMCVCVLNIAVFGRRKRLKHGICGARSVLGPTQIVGWHHYLWDHLKGGCAQQLLC